MTRILLTKVKGKPFVKIVCDNRVDTVIHCCRKLDKRQFVRPARGKPYWKAPATDNNIIKLSALKGKDVQRGVAFIRREQKIMELGVGSVPAHYSGIKMTKVKDIDGLKKKLYDYQVEGVSFIQSRDGNVLLADEMGLGKTLQVLAWLQLRPELRPVLIVCPSTLKLNWHREILESTSIPESEIRILEGRKPDRNLEGSVWIINYDVLQHWKPLFRLKKFRPLVMVCDECHNIKNRKTKRSKAANVIAKLASHVIGVSGTPIINRPIEFFLMVHMIDPKLFPSYWHYVQRYCDVKINKYGGSWDTGGDANMQELHKVLVGSIMLRRLKADVLPQLPAKQRTVVPFTIRNKAEYNAALRDFKGWLRSKGKDESKAIVLAQITALKKLAVEGKIKAVVEWVLDFLESGEKLVLFCSHHATVDVLKRELGRGVVAIDDRTPMKERTKHIHAFQHTPFVRVLVGTLKTVSAGITLTAASNVAKVELGWTPGEHDQAEDRVHRIGQQSGAVNIWYLVAVGTIEMDILELIDKKREVLAAALDGKPVADFNLMKQLLKRIGNPSQNKRLKV